MDTNAKIHTYVAKQIKCKRVRVCELYNKPCLQVIRYSTNKLNRYCKVVLNILTTIFFKIKVQ